MSDQTIDRQVEVIEPQHTSCALKALTLAFAEDPPSRWLFPEPEAFARHFAEFALAFGGGAIADGTALEIEGHAGVALWMSPGIEPDEGALLDVIERSVTAPRRARVHDLLAEMGRLHPSGDHWYLPLIGVDPRRQGAGLGSALLRPALRAADAMQLPAYLEATCPLNVRLYLRHGFEPTGEIRIHDCPVITPMLRQPRGR